MGLLLEMGFKKNKSKKKTPKHQVEDENTSTVKIKNIPMNKEIQIQGAEGYT